MRWLLFVGKKNICCWIIILQGNGQTLNVARQREALLCIMRSSNICTTLILALLLIGIKLAH